MTGMGDHDVNVSTWGYHIDDEGDERQMWSVRVKGVRVGFLVVEHGVTTEEVYDMAVQAFG